MASVIDRITLGELEIAIVDVDPSTLTGYAAAQGSLVIAQSNSTLYQKQGALDTDWTIVRTLTTEEIQDAVAGLISSGSQIEATYDDPGNTLTLSIVAGSVTATELASNSVTNVKVAAGLDAVKIGAGSVDNTEFGFLDGVTSSIQTQLNNKQGLDATLTALAAYNTNGILTQTAPDTFVGRTVTGSASVGVTNGDGVAGNPTLAVLPAGVDHNSLNNLAVGDVHTQYALLAGRSGGQNINGDTASGGNLTLNSTSNATKGRVIIGTNAIDQANNRLGIGVAAPATTLDLLSNGVSEQKSMASLTTTNATAATLFTIPTVSNTVQLAKIRFTGINTTTNNSVAYERTVRIKNIGGTVTLGVFQADYTNEDGPMSPCNVQAVVSGTNVLIQAIGIAATNINWKAILDRMV